MPFLELQKWLGVDIDRWNLSQSSSQPFKKAAKCHAFEKLWLECAEGIGELRARQECKLELEDLHECTMMQKTFLRIKAITDQKSKMIKEGKYTPPEHHKQS